MAMILIKLRKVLKSYTYNDIPRLVGGAAANAECSYMIANQDIMSTTSLVQYKRIPKSSTILTQMSPK
jgi:hypothetical protein